MFESHIEAYKDTAEIMKQIEVLVTNTITATNFSSTVYQFYLLKANSSKCLLIQCFTSYLQIHFL